MARPGLVVAVLLAALLAGCGSQPTFDHLATTFPAHRELETVPFFPQTTRQCGAAALATVLAYRGLVVTPEGLESQLFTPGKGGTLAIDIVAQARNHGMLVYPIQPGIDDLLAEVDAGNPVLILQNLGLGWLAQWHFAVVTGFDLDKRELILRSGSEARHRVSMRTFVNTWERADYWGVVILPPGQIPASARAIPYLQAASDLERRLPLAAWQAYRAAWQKWHDDSEAEGLARLGLFNIAFAAGHYPEAKHWLLSGKGPLMAVHWNNLAFCLSAMQCHPQAELAARCAIALDPDNPVYQQSLDELEASAKPGTTASPGAACAIPMCPRALPKQVPDS